MGEVDVAVNAGAEAPDETQGVKQLAAGLVVVDETTGGANGGCVGEVV